MNMDLLIVAVLMSLFFQTNHVDCESCPASTPTVKEVEECPKTEEEWRIASETKQCQRMQSHNCKSFVYHCLMNQKENAFLEVCAPTWFISGFCAMFNTEEERVIDNFKLDCTNFTEGEKCPSRFISNEAYKYQKCYEHVRRKIQDATKLTPAATCTDRDSASSGSESNTSLIVAVVILSVLVIALLVILFMIKKQINCREVIWRKDRTPTQRSPRQSETERLLHEESSDIRLNSNTDVEKGITANSEQEIEAHKPDVQKGFTPADAKANIQKEIQELKEKGPVNSKRENASKQIGVFVGTKKNKAHETSAHQEDAHNRQKTFNNDMLRGKASVATEMESDKKVDDLTNSELKKNSSSKSEREKNQVTATAKAQNQNNERKDVALSATGNVNKESETMKAFNNDMLRGNASAATEMKSDKKVDELKNSEHKKNSSSKSEPEKKQVTATAKAQNDQETDTLEDQNNVRKDVAPSATANVNKESETMKAFNNDMLRGNALAATEMKSDKKEDELKISEHKKNSSSKSEPEKNQVTATAKAQNDQETGTLEDQNNERIDVAPSATANVKKESETMKGTVKDSHQQSNSSKSCIKESEDTAVKKQVKNEKQRKLPTGSGTVSSPLPNKSEIEKEMEFLKNNRFVQNRERYKDSKESDADSSLK